ncbi:MAG TPA: glycosyltransferase family 4 protein [Anaerolineales bacterium]|nr:glycosyltransferase family 4 protein [Anaerolineales bacterium]
MRLTLINQFYPPDFAPTGELAASLAEHRVQLGDQVTVVTSQGGYVPESPVEAAPPTSNPRIHRLWTPRLGKQTLALRLIDYSLFYAQAAIRLALLPQQDLIVSLTTPPLIALAGALHKWLHRETRLILWSMDCYPEVPERAGVLRPGSIPSRFIRWLNRRLFRALDYLVCLDTPMEQLLKAQYESSNPKLPTSVIHNWEPAMSYPKDLLPPPWPMAGELDLSGKFVVLYLGNAGYGHRFETVLDAADQLRTEPVIFVFIGGGQKWSELKRTKEQRGLANLHVLRYVPDAETQSAMAAADCALVTLRDSYLGVISPSKIHSNLAMGLPLIYIGPEGGNVDEAIRLYQCGVSLHHGDVDGTVEFIRRLQAQPKQLKVFRSQARRAFEEAYSDVVCLPQFDRVLEQVMGRSPA